MKRLFVLFLIVMLIVSISVPVKAVTPQLKPVEMPEVPEIHVEMNEGIMTNWLIEHPIKVPTYKRPCLILFNWLDRLF